MKFQRRTVSLFIFGSFDMFQFTFRACIGAEPALAVTEVELSNAPCQDQQTWHFRFGQIRPITSVSNVLSQARRSIHSLSGQSTLAPSELCSTE
jgi:hypothetical protein